MHKWKSSSIKLCVRIVFNLIENCNYSLPLYFNTRPVILLIMNLINVSTNWSWQHGSGDSIRSALEHAQNTRKGEEVEKVRDRNASSEQAVNSENAFASLL